MDVSPPRHGARAGRSISTNWRSLSTAPPRRSEVMSEHDNAALARACYDAYVSKDRASMEKLLAEDFHFTSPLDNRLDRATYFARCWPNSGTIAGFDFIHLVPHGDRVFVTYVARTRDGHQFRN